MTNRSTSIALWFTACLVAAGCTGTQEPGQQGELGNDRFFYACISDLDAMCDGDTEGFEQEPIYGVPVIARGARFGITTEGTSTEARVPDAREGRIKEALQSDGTLVFTAEAIGWSVLLSQTFNGDTVDVLHVSVEEPSALKLYDRALGSTDWADSSATSVNLGASDRHQLRIAPQNSTGVLLAGALDIVWTSEPEGVVSVTPAQGNNIVLLAPIKDGTATITATAGSFSRTATVTVTGAGEGGGGQGGNGQGGNGQGGNGQGGEGGGQ